MVTKLPTPFRARVGALDAALVALACLGGPVAALAQDTGRTVYRCPGPPVLYTDAITTEQAKERGCRPITGAPLTVVQVPRRPAGNADGSAAPARGEGGAPRGEGAAAPRAGSTPEANRVDPALQRERDAQARRILQTELSSAQAQLDALVQEYNGGQPERRADERNAAQYFERVARLKAGIERKQADIAALQRELAKSGS
jgi:hypothetical protein